jgi:copper chaperone CopZ
MTTCTLCELHAESTFKIEGMDCHEEVAVLEHRLKRLSGLEALDADVIGQRLRIKYDAAKLSAASISEAVAQTGMRAWLEHEEPVLAPASGTSRERLVILSGVAFGVGLLRQQFSSLPDPVWSWLPFVVAMNHFDGAAEHTEAEVRDALALDPAVPMVQMDARSERHCTDTLIRLVQHALELAD